MKYKTLKTSKTGISFVDLFKQMKEAEKEISAFIEKFGTKEYYRSGNALVGFHSLKLTGAGEPPLGFRVDKDLTNSFLPALKTKEGREVKKEINALPFISIDGANNCIGWDGKIKNCHYGNIGYATNDEYVFICAGDDWNIDMPKDCEEITVTEFKRLTEKGK